MTNRFVDNYLLAQLAVLSHTLSDEFYRYLRDHGVTPSRWRILLNLSDTKGLYITQLADRTCYEQSRVTKSIQSLEKEGLVARRPCDADKRRVKVDITDAGEKLLLPLIRAAKLHEKKVLSEISLDDAERLQKILATFVQNHVDSFQETERVDSHRLLKRVKLA